MACARNAAHRKVRKKNQMTENEQRIAIAEACGWKIVETPGQAYSNLSLQPDPKTYWRECWETQLPDYLNDLNAMHEAETTVRLNQFQAVDYPHNVFKVVTDLEWKGDMGYFFPMVIRATAAQRAEAFLRTIGKWVDEVSA